MEINGKSMINKIKDALPESIRDKIERKNVEAETIVGRWRRRFRRWRRREEEKEEKQNEELAL